MRFGLPVPGAQGKAAEHGEEPRTLQEIGEKLGLSRERIRQIESKAKEKLRATTSPKGSGGTSIECRGPRVPCRERNRICGSGH